MDGSRDYYDVYFLWRPSDSWLTFQCCKGACQFLTVQGLTAGVRPAITLAYQLRQSLLQYDQQPLLASEGEKGIDSLPSKELALCKQLVTSMLFWNCAETFPSAQSQPIQSRCTYSITISVTSQSRKGTMSFGFATLLARLTLLLTTTFNFFLDMIT